jgi:hypothetical protein
MPELQLVNCSFCKSLTRVGDPEAKLVKLECRNCPILTSIPHISRILNCDGCSWLKNKNVEFEENIQSLRKCQAMWKRKLTAIRLERLIPQLIELYYLPGYKGAMIAEKRFSQRVKTQIK